MPGVWERAFCLTCGYSLAGLPQPRCPECGRPFDPADLESVAVGRPLSRFMRWALNPIGWPLLTAAGVGSILTVTSSATPGSYLFLLAHGLLIWVLAGLVYLVRLILHLLAVARYPKARSVSELKPLRWLLIPILALGTYLVSGSSWPGKVAFRLSRPSMDRFVQEVAAYPPGTLILDRWIGLYPAEKIEMTPWGVRFLVRGSDFFKIHYFGFAYSSGEPPPNTPEEVQRSTGTGDYHDPIEGNWYRWHQVNF